MSDALTRVRAEITRRAEERADPAWRSRFNILQTVHFRVPMGKPVSISAVKKAKKQKAKP